MISRANILTRILDVFMNPMYLKGSVTECWFLTNHSKVLHVRLRFRATFYAPFLWLGAFFNALIDTHWENNMALVQDSQDF